MKISAIELIDLQRRLGAKVAIEVCEEGMIFSIERDLGMGTCTYEHVVTFAQILNSDAPSIDDLADNFLSVMGGKAVSDDWTLFDSGMGKVKVTADRIIDNE